MRRFLLLVPPSLQPSIFISNVGWFAPNGNKTEASRVRPVRSPSINKLFYKSKRTTYYKRSSNVGKSLLDEASPSQIIQKPERKTVYQKSSPHFISIIQGGENCLLQLKFLKLNLAKRVVPLFGLPLNHHHHYHQHHHRHHHHLLDLHH
jgi:hypothetical protein